MALKVGEDIVALINLNRLPVGLVSWDATYHLSKSSQRQASFYAFSNLSLSLYLTRAFSHCHEHEKVWELLPMKAEQ